MPPWFSPRLLASWRLGGRSSPLRNSPRNPMAHTVTIPAVGESITEGILSRWLVADGSQVEASTPLYELETDKITTEVQAGVAGVVRFTAKAGDTLPIGA